MRSKPLVSAAMLAISLAGSAVAGASGSPPLDSELVEQGRLVYQQYCASCHGAKGEGVENWQQRNERGELPPPPHDEDGHTWRHADSMLYRMVSEGWRDPFNETDRLTMPPFEDVLSSEQIRAVITYLKTMWTPEQREYQREETQLHGGFPPGDEPTGEDAGRNDNGVRR